ncbi:uncharacterized protein CXQ87_000191 [Candidozyma duobushaemuli]|uniref:Pal1 cell morphology protein n=1 Tax=Candidozyma duobushaemuli TaxID=1231522 RepID=A0A2V1AG33_9ASCO|nr:uncharacterized protein CXQ87_000191 [[Candida] duobushaemulonis]PVH17307.1 hypothetical protein CXQ87_000191 [[Candida] duobushaemulonis]
MAMNHHSEDTRSASSSRRLSSNNPFRQSEPQTRNRGASTQSSSSAFEQWVEKNKDLIEDSDEERDQVYERPSFPSSTRTGSDSDVNYGSVSSSQRSKPPRPAKDSKPAPAPPTYEEAAGRNAASREYPQEKSSSRSERPERSERSRRYGNRPQRSRSDSERHRKDYEKKHRSYKSRNKSPKKKSVEPHNSKGLDTIDKLDVSAFFGGRFHHDGPFDACTPHRNKNQKAAPVMAFPADGPNTSMKALPKGANKDSHLYMAFGDSHDRNEIVGSVGAQNGGIQAVPKTNRTSNDPSTMYTPRQNPSVTAFDVHAKAEPIHGPSTAGLGSTTFLDGAPAPRTDDFLNVPSSGLGRKKSLVHRLRKNSGSESNSARTSNDNSDEFTRGTFADEDAQGSSFLRRVKSLKVSRRS